LIQASHLRFDIRQASKKILVGLLVLAGLNAIFYFISTRPALKEYRKLEATTRPDFDEIKQRERAVTRLESFRDGLQQAETDLQTLRDDVLSTRDARMVLVQAELQALCDEFKIDLESVSYDHDLLVAEGLDRLAMTVPLEGGYANLRKFLQAVEKSDKFLLVERVGLSSGKQGGRMLDLSIELATYFNAPREFVEQGRSTGRGGRRRGR